MEKLTETECRLWQDVELLTFADKGNKAKVHRETISRCLGKENQAMYDI